ncbi:SUKH-4 family immunity protein [Actinacidiphila acididurans]|uniref:SUKH-4 family immunity protein n=1 Tax=Actinacidiphila acididurans TaxID=2784346 RepID=A0ABS2TP70_9ACTN|nr:SUKH-4 family immunity protein [Actinacidiphila acididurans]MBM9504035.1 SUKH-4 family immunity protein [Actinacidiphila acididurans]
MTLFYEDLAYEDLCDWAGEEHVERADPDGVRDWDLPDADKAVLTRVGVPHLDRLVSRTYLRDGSCPMIRTDSGGLLYPLAEFRHPRFPDRAWGLFGAEPGTGVVHHVGADGVSRRANSSVVLWVQCLHHCGIRTDSSDVLLNPDRREEEDVLTELQRLKGELGEFDPAAIGDSNDGLWAVHLDRWLW